MRVEGEKMKLVKLGWQRNQLRTKRITKLGKEKKTKFV